MASNRTCRDHDLARLCLALASAGALASAAGAAPPPPLPSATVSTVVVANTSTAAIPDGGAITSTITVSGAGAYLWDVDLRTLLPHSFPTDLDVTLRSPAGTLITICTDAGAGNDDVFNGTWWDDGAGGPPPKPAGPVTDYEFTNHSVADELVPEGAMSAFVGENPNGVWTLTVADDHAGDTGSLNGWTLRLSTCEAPPLTAVATHVDDAMLPLADAGATTREIVVAPRADGAPETLVRIDLETFISHTACGDLDIVLISPAGTVVTISTDNGGTLDNLFNGTVWRDAGATGPVTDAAFVNGIAKGSLVPEEAMGAFRGENPAGVWTLRIDDDRFGDAGQLQSWSLTLTTTGVTQPPPPPPPPAVCACDFNGVNGVGIQDVYDFLAAWSAADPAADYNAAGGVTVQDIYDFLGCVVNTFSGTPCP